MSYEDSLNPKISKFILAFGASSLFLNMCTQFIAAQHCIHRRNQTLLQ